MHRGWRRAKLCGLQVSDIRRASWLTHATSGSCSEAPVGAQDSSPGRNLSRCFRSGALGKRPSRGLRHPPPVRAGEGTGVRGGNQTHGSRRGLSRSAGPPATRADWDTRRDYQVFGCRDCAAMRWPNIAITTNYDEFQVANSALSLGARRPHPQKTTLSPLGERVCRCPDALYREAGPVSGPVGRNAKPFRAEDLW
jgi:hypothetical protein